MTLNNAVGVIEREIYRQQREQVRGTDSPIVFGDRYDPCAFYVTSRQTLRRGIRRAIKQGISQEMIIAKVLKKVVVPGAIHIGGEQVVVHSHPLEYTATYKTALGKPITISGIKASSISYHPSHVSSLISHESLHQAMHKVAHAASDSIDNREIFGKASELSPTGVLDFEIMRGRVARQLEIERRLKNPRRFQE